MKKAKLQYTHDNVMLKCYPDILYYEMNKKYGYEQN